MTNSFHKLPLGTQRFSGYVSNPANATPEYISYPSQNCLVTDDGQVEQRLGFQEEFSIGVDGSAATSFYLKTYDVAFFALGTKVYYRDFQTGQTYDTGLTLTAGTTTRFTEWFGNVFCTNTTDGPRMIICGRVNDSAANSGDANITIDQDMAARINAFSAVAAVANTTLRIEGTNEAVASLVTTTGVVTLDAPLSQGYDDNTFAIVTYDISGVTGIQKPSKIVFWKNRLHGMGFPNVDNFDQPNNSVNAGQFVIGDTAAAGIELIINFTWGTGGSTKIQVGGGGKVTNILGATDNFWFLTEDQTFSAANSSIATSGSEIGLTIPKEQDLLHGCFNEDCATMMGDNAFTYLSSDRKIMRQRIDTPTGAAVANAEEDFDVDIRDHMKNLDRDQTGAFVFYYRGGRQTIYQLKELGQWKWFIWDHNIIRNVGGNPVRGAWQPPQLINAMKSLFERNGVLYGTDASDDTVYSIFTTFTDNLSPIYTIIATGEFNVGNAIMDEAYVQGEINQPSQIKLHSTVWNNAGQERSGSIKTVLGSGYTYSEDNSVGAVPVGDAGIQGETTQVAKWDKTWGIFPSEGTRVKIQLENEQDGGYFTLSSFQLTGRQYPSSFSSSV